MERGSKVLDSYVLRVFVGGGGEGWDRGGTKGGGTWNSCRLSSMKVAEHSHPMPLQITETKEESRRKLTILEER